MSDFIEECRREWRRLGVPDPVANEMAADLHADLEEAESEGGSAEDVLGNSAFDPRRFAAAWATARGVTGLPIPERPSFWRRPSVAITLTVLLGVLIVVAGSVFLISLRGHSFAFATRQVVAGPGSIRVFPAGPGRISAVPSPLGPFVGHQVAGIDVHPLALLLLIVGVVGLGVVAVLLWSLWSGPRRYHRRGGGRTPNWN